MGDLNTIGISGSPNRASANPSRVASTFVPALDTNVSASDSLSISSPSPSEALKSALGADGQGKVALPSYNFPIRLPDGSIVRGSGVLQLEGLGNGIYDIALQQAQANIISALVDQRDNGQLPQGISLTPDGQGGYTFSRPNSTDPSIRYITTIDSRGNITEETHTLRDGETFVETNQFNRQ